MSTDPLLSVRGLSVRFRLPTEVVHAVTDAYFDVHAGECIALVGESGCGKSVTAHALLGLLPANAEVSGSARLSPAIELVGASRRTLVQEIRGRRIGLIPQSPATHLTPVRTARSQLDEVLRLHTASGRDPAGRADELALLAGLNPDDLDRYPHELSGGMAQRVVTAVALAGDPDLLLADEPTASLDRDLVDAAMDQLRARCDEGRAVLVVTHDLRAAQRVADTVAVMYASRLVEISPADAFFDQPEHPYSRRLLDALPDRSFEPIPGLSPALTDLPAGCAFAPRCSEATGVCAGLPRVRSVGPVSVACHHRAPSLTGADR